MRIALITTSPKSAELFFSGIASHLVAQGHMVTVISGIPDEESAFFKKDRVSVVRVSMKRNPSLIADLVSLWKMAKALRRIQPDVVMYATPKASLIAALSAAYNRVPVRIYALWGLRFETVSGIARIMLLAFEKIIAKLSTAVLANSASLAAKAQKHCISKGGRVDVLGSGSSHGVDLTKFSKFAQFQPVDQDTEDFLLSHPGITIGFVGRLHRDKGIDTLFDAAECLTSEGTQLKLILVGPDEGFAFEKRWSGVPTCRVGEVQDIRPYLNEIDVLVLMSLREGFPNVVLEAAAMQVPAVVSDATGCIDSVEDGITGIVVPCRDVKALAKTLRHLARDGEYLNRLGANARERVLRDFSQENLWRETEEYLVLKSTSAAQAL